MIMRGDRRGLEGKITQIDKKNYRIFIEGITREKVDGTTTLIPIHPSKVMITKLNLDDKWRKKILERKSPSEKAETQKES
jgi:ribosomal protein uL24